MTLKQEISARIKRVREHLKMTPTEFSVATKVQAQTIRDYENAKSIPGGAFLAALTELGISVEWILTGVGYITYKFEELPAESSITELRTDRRVSQATYKESREISDVDMNLLEVAEVVVHRYYAREGVNPPPERIARQVVAIYRYAAAKGIVEKDDLEAFVKLIA